MKLTEWIFFKLSGIANRFQQFFSNRARAIQLTRLPESEQNKIKWYQDGGDKKLRYSYALNQGSVVLDVGGYEGDWSAEIYARYRCRIYVLEPVRRFYKLLEERFKENPDITLVNQGLGAKDEELEFFVMEEASSSKRSETMHKSGTTEKVKIVDASGFIQSQGITSIDLVKINIEGAEYELLNRLIDTKLIASVKNIQVQFHDFVPDAKRKYEKIKNRLSDTHHLTWSYPFVWENWKRNAEE